MHLICYLLYSLEIHKCVPWQFLNFKAPYTTKAEFANTVDPDETAHHEPSHLDLQCLSSSPFIFNIIKLFELKVFENFADVILSSAFLALYELTFAC